MNINDAVDILGVSTDQRELDDATAEMLADLKEKINNMLWMSLPGTCTIDKAEEIAEEIHSLICDVWEEC